MRPKLEEAWQDPETVILTEDEMKLSTQTTFQKIWLPEGEYPKVAVSGTRKSKSIILWDGPGSHRGKEVSGFVKDDGRIELVYFPPYTPELNPQEHIWKEGRKEVTNNQFIPDVEKVAVDFVNYLNNKSFPYSLLGFSAES